MYGLERQINRPQFLIFIISFVSQDYLLLPERISKRGSVLKVRGGCYNYRFKLYK